jgi:hypothetical protein
MMPGSIFADHPKPNVASAKGQQFPGTKKEVMDNRSLPGTLQFLSGATSEMACAPGAQRPELKAISSVLLS